MKNQSGLALVTLLLLVAVLALYSFYALQNTLLENKQMLAYQLKNQINLAAGSILSEIEERVQFKTLPCWLSGDAVLPVEDKDLLSRLRRLSCAGNFADFQYYYQIVELPSALCIAVPVGLARVPAVFLQISVQLVSLVQPQANVIWQSVVVKPMPSGVPCDHPIRLVARGRQSLREIRI